MDSIVRAAAMYAMLLVFFRLSGKRTLSETTTFDLLMLLVISETTQQAMVDDDHSFTHAVLLILTFLVLNIGISVLKQRSRTAAKVLEDVPVILVAHGRVIKERLDKERVDEDDILEAARLGHGVARMEEIEWAVLERDGEVSIVPRAAAR